MLCNASKKHQDDKRQNVTSHWVVDPQVPHPSRWQEKWLMKSEHALQTLASYGYLGKPQNSSGHQRWHLQTGT